MPLSKDIDDILNPLLSSFDKQIEAELEGQLSTIYVAGQAEVISYGKTKMGIPVTYEGPPVSGAIDWAKKHSATLVKGLDDETKKRLAHTISQGIQNKRGIPGLSRDIRKEFADMSKYRANMIARTETAEALSTASLDNMTGMGIDGKEWVWPGTSDCEICADNAAQGVIPVGQAFSSGHQAPPAHPHCECTLAPAFLPGRAAPEPKPKPKIKKPSIPTTKITKPSPTTPKPAKGKLSSDDWAKSITKDEKRVLDYWQGSGYEDIRLAQRTGKAPSHIKGAIKDLNKALDRADAYDGQVFRGLSNLDKKTFDLIKNSKELKWDALSSSAKSEQAAARFLRGGKGDSVMFRIQNKTGVDLTSLYKQEAEVLLRKDAKYRVVSQVEKVYTVGKDKVKALEMVLMEI